MIVFILGFVGKGISSPHLRKLLWLLNDRVMVRVTSRDFGKRGGGGISEKYE